MGRQMFEYRRLNRLAATENVCISVVMATMRSDGAALGGLASIRRAAQVQSPENVIAGRRPLPLGISSNARTLR
jgi:hypothetical protein